MVKRTRTAEGALQNNKDDSRDLSLRSPVVAAAKEKRPRDQSPESTSNHLSKKVKPSKSSSDSEEKNHSDDTTTLSRDETQPKKRKLSTGTPNTEDVVDATVTSMSEEPFDTADVVIVNSTVVEPSNESTSSPQPQQDEESPSDVAVVGQSSSHPNNVLCHTSNDDSSSAPSHAHAASSSAWANSASHGGGGGGSHRSDLFPTPSWPTSFPSFSTTFPSTSSSTSLATSTSSPTSSFLNLDRFVPSSSVNATTTAMSPMFSFSSSTNLSSFAWGTPSKSDTSTSSLFGSGSAEKKRTFGDVSQDNSAFSGAPAYVTKIGSPSWTMKSDSFWDRMANSKQNSTSFGMTNGTSNNEDEKSPISRRSSSSFQSPETEKLLQGRQKSYADDDTVLCHINPQSEVLSESWGCRMYRFDEAKGWSGVGAGLGKLQLVTRANDDGVLVGRLVFRNEVTECLNFQGLVFKDTNFSTNSSNSSVLFNAKNLLDEASKPSVYAMKVNPQAHMDDFLEDLEHLKRLLAEGASPSQEEGGSSLPDNESSNSSPNPPPSSETSTTHHEGQQDEGGSVVSAELGESPPTPPPADPPRQLPNSGKYAALNEESSEEEGSAASVESAVVDSAVKQPELSEKDPVEVSPQEGEIETL